MDEVLLFIDRKDPDENKKAEELLKSKGIPYKTTVSTPKHGILPAVLAEGAIFHGVSGIQWMIQNLSKK
jgi:hypothetical protein